MALMSQDVLFSIAGAEVRHDGNGNYLLDDGDSVWGASDLQELRDLVEQADLLSGEHDLSTGSWDLPRILAFWSGTDPGWDPSLEVLIDEILVNDSACGPLPALQDFEAFADPLASVSWDLGPGGAGYPGGSDSGEYLLFRFGERYLVVSRSVGEYEAEQIEATDDAEAIAWFEDAYQEG